MSGKTGIRWTASTWNPIAGCSKVSPGCAHCYAETLSLRYGWSKAPWTPENAAVNVVLHPERLALPLRWPDPRRIFVNSMSDLFHELAPVDYIARAFAVMALATRHTFQVLTKRPDRMAGITGAAAFRTAVRNHAARMTDVPRRRDGLARLELVDALFTAAEAWPLPNVWLGTSIENDRWTVRADDLREATAAVRFISAEPLLGPLPSLDLTSIDWLIVGGESGPGFRPMDHAWARDLRDRAVLAGTCYYFKQSAAPRTETGTRLIDESGEPQTWEEYPDDPSTVSIHRSATIASLRASGRSSPSTESAGSGTPPPPARDATTASSSGTGASPGPTGSPTSSSSTPSRPGSTSTTSADVDSAFDPGTSKP